MDSRTSRDTLTPLTGVVDVNIKAEVAGLQGHESQQGDHLSKRCVAILVEGIGQALGGGD